MDAFFGGGVPFGLGGMPFGAPAFGGLSPSAMPYAGIPPAPFSSYPGADPFSAALAAAAPSEPLWPTESATFGQSAQAPWAAPSFPPVSAPSEFAAPDVSSMPSFGAPSVPAFPSADAAYPPAPGFGPPSAPSFPPAFGAPEFAAPPAQPPQELATPPAAPEGVPPGVAPAPAGAGPEDEEDQDPDHQHNLECGHFYNTLGYWKIRGLASPIRMMLAYQGVEYQNKFYDIEKLDDGSWDRSQWLEHKAFLKTNNPLINLPYLEAVDDEGGIVLAQSNAVLNHLGRRFNLIGCTEIDAAKADMLMEQCHDLRESFSKLCYGSKDGFAAAKEEYFKEGGTFEEQLNKFEDWMNAQGTTFLVEDDHPITADFVFWELLDIHNKLQPDCLEKFPKVAELYRNFHALPNLQEYFDSELHQLPVCGPMAAWR
eukprot:NODE_360_length_1584_cov_782.269707_g231_i1.p1 GENE.NODE_360_length_1584_cov_782.269707_g231_i1~~NODE_360_length_1584_cov_782.269707_g231_i1.p1  ORF type:complete len:426 (+),score=135.31 NODE_360_length_1584_cov_782.269707_g231_i1:59-1336(+)